MIIDVTLILLLALVAAAGLGLAVLQLPGIWLILAAGVAYDWYFDWSRITWVWLLALLGLAVASEIFDALAGAFAARKAGASKQATIGAFIGGFAGMIIFSIPIPVLGTVVGGLLGCFCGALIGEMSVRSDMTAGTKIGTYAVLGKVIGIVAKTGAALAVAGGLLTLAAMGWWAENATRIKLW